MLGFYLTLLDTADEKIKFEELYKMYKDTMYNYAYSILKDHYLAEDSVHNAFMRLIKYLGKIHKTDCNETRNYLVIIVKNTSYDLYYKRKNDYPIDDAIDISDEIDLPEIVESKLDHEKIFGMIANMEEKYADILMLKFFYDCTTDEISKLLDIKTERVAICVYRAKEKLKQMILGEYKDEWNGI